MTYDPEFGVETKIFFSAPVLSIPFKLRFFSNVVLCFVFFDDGMKAVTRYWIVSWILIPDVDLRYSAVALPYWYARTPRDQV